MPDNRKKVSPGNPSRKPYLPWLVLGGLLALAGAVSLFIQPERKTGSPGTAAGDSAAFPAAERPALSPRPAESPSPRTPAPKAAVQPDGTIIIDEPDPVLQKLDLAFSTGRCDEITEIAGPDVLADGTREAYASLLYSEGVGYWEQKDYRKAANYMRCFLKYYQSYQDEVLLVLTDSEITLGEKNEARRHLQDLKTRFPHRNKEIENLEQKLVLGK